MRLPKTSVVTMTLATILIIPAISTAVEIQISFPARIEAGAIDGRVLLLLSTNNDQEPRFQVRGGVRAIQVFGLEVDALAPGDPVIFDDSVPGYPMTRLGDLPAGDYYVQAVLHRYETFRRSDGHTVKLPMDRGEGQQWNRAPGNLYSDPTIITIDPTGGTEVAFTLENIIPPVDSPCGHRVRQTRADQERAPVRILGPTVLPWRPRVVAVRL